MVASQACASDLPWKLIANVSAVMLSMAQPSRNAASELVLADPARAGIAGLPVAEAHQVAGAPGIITEARLAT